MIGKSNITRHQPSNDKDNNASVENNGISMQNIVKHNEIGSPEVSPRATSGKYFLSMQMTPNPLIKNSFASPVKEQANKSGNGDLQAYVEPSATGKASRH